MIYNFLSDYLSIIIFLFIALFLSIGFIVANYLASPSNPDPEKLSAYECGFDAFDDSRMEFDVRFYLVAILFIIFDLEIAFFPMGNFIRKHWSIRVLVNDDFFSHFDNWFYLRMEKRSFRMGIKFGLNNEKEKKFQKSLRILRRILRKKAL